MNEGILITLIVSNLLFFLASAAESYIITKLVDKVNKLIGKEP